MSTFIIEGFDDIHYDELMGYDEIINTIENLMLNYGYKQVLTPTFESYDMYDIDGAFPRQNMYKLIDHDGKVLVLRPDATIPITRMAATCYKNREEIIKLGYITTIFRSISSNTDSRKEFIQAGVEYLGNSLHECDAEIIALAINILIALKIDNIRIDIGEVTYLNSLFDEINIGKHDEKIILDYIEDKNIGDLKTYLSSIKIPKDISDVFCDIPRLYGKFPQIIDEAKKLSVNEGMRRAVKNVEETYEIVKKYGYQDLLYVDFGFTNQLNYYSGLIFKGYINGVGESILSGGRYDSLSSSFGVDRPASGFGINISLLVDVLKKPSNSMHYFDLLLIYDDNDTDYAIDISKKLRSLKINTDCINSIYEFNIRNDAYRFIAKLKDSKLYLYGDNDWIEIDIKQLSSILKEDIL